MIPIDIDISDIVREFSRINVEDLASTIVSTAVAELRGNIELNASRSLGSTREQYLNSIVSDVVDPNYGYVELQGELANMVEQGASPFDLKDGFSKSNSVKYNKDGEWYLDIPFKHGTPGSSGNDTASVMPKNVYDIARRMKPGSRLPGIDVPSPSDQPQSRPEIQGDNGGTLFAEYQHKVGIYADLTRVVDSGGSGQYLTFRRVGENSDPNSWIHKGIQARNFFENAVSGSNLEDKVDRAIDAYLQSLGY